MTPASPQQPPRFEIGDRVRIPDTGRIGTIRAPFLEPRSEPLEDGTTPYVWWYVVEDENGHDDGYEETALEKVAKRPLREIHDELRWTISGIAGHLIQPTHPQAREMLTRCLQALDTLCDLAKQEEDDE